MLSIFLEGTPLIGFENLLHAFWRVSAYEVHVQRLWVTASNKGRRHARQASINLGQNDDVELQPFRCVHGHDSHLHARRVRHTLLLNPGDEIVRPQSSARLIAKSDLDQLL